MDALRFDAWTRRRFGMVAVGTIAALLGHGATPPHSAQAKGKDKKRKLKRNEYGCVEVGGRCRGRDSVCCSGVCAGKKPKQGEKDKSRCKAHDTGTIESGDRGCLAGDDSYGPGDTLCTTSAGEEFAKCWRTTGNAGFCGLDSADVPCRKDTDCVDACGQGAACIVVPDEFGGGVFCSSTAACD